MDKTPPAEAFAPRLHSAPRLQTRTLLFDPVTVLMSHVGLRNARACVTDCRGPTDSVHTWARDSGRTSSLSIV
eukprot:2158799-Rhodomonas_salina.1